MAKIYLQRKTGWNYKVRSFDVILDGENIGKINEKKILEYEVSPGEHTLQTKVGRIKSNLFTFNIEPDEEMKITLKSSPMFKALYLLSFISLILYFILIYSEIVERSIWLSVLFLPFVVFYLYYFMAKDKIFILN